MKIQHAHVYVSKRGKPDMTPDEATVRDVSHAIKVDNPQACKIAAIAMAGKIRRHRHCLLVPVPDSQGCTTKNLRLSRAIQALAPSAKMLDMLHGAPRESQCQRDREGRHRFTADQIPVKARSVKVPAGYEKVMVYLVDNVCCTGATLEAGRRAVATVLQNEIRGLVYARTRTEQMNLLHSGNDTISTLPGPIIVS